MSAFSDITDMTKPIVVHTKTDDFTIENDENEELSFEKKVDDVSQEILSEVSKQENFEIVKNIQALFDDHTNFLLDWQRNYLKMYESSPKLLTNEQEITRSEMLKKVEEEFEDLFFLAKIEIINQNRLGIGELAPCLYQIVSKLTLKNDIVDGLEQFKSTTPIIKHFSIKGIKSIFPPDIELTTSQGCIAQTYLMIFLKSFRNLETIDIDLDDFYNLFVQFMQPMHTAIALSDGSVFEFYKQVINALLLNNSELKEVHISINGEGGNRLSFNSLVDLIPKKRL